MQTFDFGGPAVPEFADRLKKLRIDRNLTQTRMAELLGVNPRAYNRWERGGITPHFDTIIKIADILQVTLDELSGRREATTEPRIRNHRLHELYQQVDQLPDKDQEAVVILLDSLIKRHSIAKVVAS